MRSAEFGDSSSTREVAVVKLKLTLSALFAVLACGGLWAAPFSGTFDSTGKREN